MAKRRKPLIGTTVTEEKLQEIKDFAEKVERRSVAGLIKLLLEEYMNGRIIKNPEASGLSVLALTKNS